MKNIQNKKKIQIMIFVLIAVITLGVGYAAITAINLVTNGNATATENQENFKVKFTTAAVTTGTGTAAIDTNDPKVATFDVTGLTKVGDTAVATYTVLNDSSGIGARISLNLTNSNTEYFSVTEAIGDTELQAGDTTTATVTVTMLKTPIEAAVSSSITGTLTASPLENASATGSAGASVQNPTAFAGDSWATIKTNVQNGNTSQYNIGDTRTVTIGGNNYTVRLVNKTTGDHCGDNDTGYSQTACGFVVEFAEVVETRAMNSTSTCVGGWPATEMRTYLNGSFYNSLPSALKTAIKPTRVISGYGCISGWDNSTKTCGNPDNSGNNFTSTNQTLYLLSGAEIHGADEYDTSSGVTHQLEYYVGMTEETVDCSWYPGCTITQYTKAIKQYNSSDYSYWLRSANSIGSNSFRSVASNGALNLTGANYTGNGVAPAFRIG